MKRTDVKAMRRRAAGMLDRAGIVLRREEKAAIEVSDFGLGDVEHLGLLVVVYESNDRYCAKEIVLLPRQMCPEHRHPLVSEANPGKRETFRCRWGTVYLYVAGEPAPKPKAKVPAEYAHYLTVRHEIILRPGDQYTLAPDSLHWFQAGDRGAVLSEFSSTSIDELDIWTDPRLRRLPEVD
jgi:D-lyxose ketol-isomerase